jgi:hypothetical protein
MKMALSMVSAVALAAVVAASSALAHDGDNGNHNGWANGNHGNHNGWANGNNGNHNGHSVRGAPGPMMGFGSAPLLALGYGFYWLRKRRAAPQS